MNCVRNRYFKNFAKKTASFSYVYVYIFEIRFLCSNRYTNDLHYMNVIEKQSLKRSAKSCNVSIY